MDQSILEETRETLKRSRDRDYFIKRFPGLPARRALQREISETLPIASRYDVEKDDLFWKLIIAARMHVTSMPGASFEEGLTHLAKAVVRSMEVTQDDDLSVEHPVRAETGEREAPAEKPAAAGRWVSDGPSGPEVRIPIFTEEAGAEHGFAPALLGPVPPETATSEEVSQWLAGELSSPRGLRIRLRDEIVEAIIIEAETELTSDADAFFSRPGMSGRVMADSFPQDGRWLLDLATDQRGAQDDQHVCDALRAAVTATIRAWFPDRPARLKDAGAEICVGEEMFRMIQAAVELEAAFIQETGEDGPHRPEADPRGSISPEARVRRGVVLERACFCHFVAGYPMDEAITLGLVELRCAQAIRMAPEEDRDAVYASFDAEFFKDCRRSLDAYMISSKDLSPSL